MFALHGEEMRQSRANVRYNPQYEPGGMYRLPCVLASLSEKITVDPTTVIFFFADISAVATR